MESRKDHLALCKQRALEYAERNELGNAVASMLSDLGKHEETKNHPAMMLLSMTALTESKEALINCIKGFN